MAEHTGRRLTHEKNDIFSSSNAPCISRVLQEIIPYIEANWESLTVAPRRIKTTWHNTIGKAMVSTTAAGDPAKTGCRPGGTNYLILKIMK